MPFITAQLLTMPAPLRDALASAPRSDLFRELTKGSFLASEVEEWPTARLPLVLLGIVAAAYEDRLGGDPGKATWRTDRYSPCPRDEAGAWFRFLAGIGYELSLIEQVVADGVLYTGEQPGEDLTTAGTPDEDTDGAHSGQDYSPSDAWFCSCDVTALARQW